MATRKTLDLKNNRIWKDKNIKPEAKRIYAYIYAKGFDQILVDLNVGELQQAIRITNVGLKNNLKLLEEFKYILYKEYARGMYEVHIC